MSSPTPNPQRDRLAVWFTARGFRSKHMRWELNAETGTGRVVFATSKNNYFVVFKDAYLGMTASSRIIRPGETWERGNDLPDGKFSKETFDKMIDAVLLYELRELSRVDGPPPWNLTLDPS